MNFSTASTSDSGSIGLPSARFETRLPQKVIGVSQTEFPIKPRAV